MDIIDFIKFFGSLDVLYDELLIEKKGELEIYNYNNYSFYAANREICYWNTDKEDEEYNYIYLDMYGFNKVLTYA